MKKDSLPQPTADLAAAIIGIWKLQSRTDVDDTGHVRVDPFLGPNPLGIICFGPKHFAAQFMKRDRSPGEAMQSRLKSENNTAGLAGYDAYFGTYTTDEIAGTLTTYLEGSISPANIGNTYVRAVRVVNDELVVQLRTTSVEGIAITRTNTFSRAG